MENIKEKKENRVDQEEKRKQPEDIILIVEDDTDIGMMVVEVLSMETPYQAVLVTDSLQAIETLHSARPLLFITDYRLPYMNGLELYDHLQNTHTLENIPTIMMSAHIPPKEELSRRNIHFLNKPFDLNNFLDVIEALLESRNKEQFTMSRRSS